MNKNIFLKKLNTHNTIKKDLYKKRLNKKKITEK
jgi:aspartate/glutamate racemase